MIPKTRIGQTDIDATRIALGLWPIAGMTSLEVNQADSLKTIHSALEHGVNFFDTAFCYGTDGESEHLLGQAIATCRDSVVVATKGGVHWATNGSRVNDASPSRLLFEFEESCRRLGTDFVDVLYLHSPDRVTNIERSAEFYVELKSQHRIRAVGLSNATLDETRRFHSVCPIDVLQPRYNMLQRDIETDLLPWCQKQGVSVAAYWPLMKGLLAGKIRRGHQFDPADKRLTYPVFQTPQWDRAQDLLDALEQIAMTLEISVAQLVIAWTLAQPGISVVLAGAKRPWQIEETIAGASVKLPVSIQSQINAALLENAIEQG